jgi:Domain of unknown function (DUF4376)
MTTVTYMDAIGINHPTVNATCHGDPTVYSNIVWIGGSPIPPQATLDADRLSIAIEEVSDNIDSMRDSIMYDHFSWDQHRWDTDRNSISNLTGINLLAVQNGGALPPGTVYRDHDNINVPMTATQMGELAAALFTFVTACYTNGWVLKAELEALTTYSAVVAFDYSGGWPETGFSVTIASIPSNHQFTVSGDFTSPLTDEGTFTVTDSANNNGTYTVSAATYDGSSVTTITVNETIPSMTVDGSIYIA